MFATVEIKWVHKKITHGRIEISKKVKSTFESGFQLSDQYQYQQGYHYGGKTKDASWLQVTGLFIKFYCFCFESS